MKRLFAILAILAMASTGCCTLTDESGVTTKSFSNCIKTVSDIACNPPAAVLSIMTGILELTRLGVATLVPGTAEYLSAVKADAAANALAAGICISIGQLNDLVVFVEGATAKSLSTQLMAKAGPMKAKALNSRPLVDWRNSFK